MVSVRDSDKWVPLWIRHPLLKDCREVYRTVTLLMLLAVYCYKKWLTRTSIMHLASKHCTYWRDDVLLELSWKLLCSDFTFGMVEVHPESRNATHGEQVRISCTTDSQGVEWEFTRYNSSSTMAICTGSTMNFQVRVQEGGRHRHTHVDHQRCFC